MNAKQTQSGGRLRDFVSCILKSSVGRDSEALLLYADGLATMRKKGITAMIRGLKAPFHTSTISRTLKRGQIRLISSKQWRIMRDDKIDRRRRFFFIFDDTTVRRYGKNVYGSGVNHDSCSDSRVWSNCLVTFQLRSKKGRWITITGFIYPGNTLKSTQGWFSSVKQSWPWRSSWTS